MSGESECLSNSTFVSATSENLVCIPEQQEASDTWILKSYRPRGSLARALYEKHINDNYLESFDKSQWYHCDLRQVPMDIAARFVQLDADEDTLNFLQQAEEKSEWLMTQIWHSVAKAFLGWFMTQTSINGWLRRGSMFVLSQSQFKKLMDKGKTWKSQSLLDLGAGDGKVTASIASIFRNVFVTEVSTTMQALLQKSGFRLLNIEDWYKVQKYDVVSCLNVLDRCDRPLLLLDQIKEALRPGSRVLIAVVLPFSSYVETGTFDHKPKELLPVQGQTFEQQVNSLIKDVFYPSGFQVLSWSRVPYLCEGDLRQSYYWLDDAIFVLETV